MVAHFVICLVRGFHCFVFTIRQQHPCRLVMASRGNISVISRIRPDEDTANNAICGSCLMTQSFRRQSPLWAVSFGAWAWRWPVWALVGDGVAPHTLHFALHIAFCTTYAAFCTAPVAFCTSHVAFCTVHRLRFARAVSTSVLQNTTSVVQITPSFCAKPKLTGGYNCTMSKHAAWICGGSPLNAGHRIF